MESFEVAVVGSGFVGSTLAKYLSRYYRIITLDLNPAPPLLEDARDIRHEVCDVRRYDEVKKKLGKPKVVIYTAIVQIPAINEVKEQAYEVNVIGTHNVCKVVKETAESLGLVLTGSWHVFGERGYKETVDTAFGYRPDKVEDIARLYVISKMVQEGIVRFYDEMTGEKIFGVVRLGTVLGENMPEKTAANIFITNGLRGMPITPYRHTMYRPMLYVSIEDVCRVFHSYIDKIIKGDVGKVSSRHHIFNLFYPEPMTILELAETVKEAVVTCTGEKIVPEIKIVDKGLPELFASNEKDTLHVDISHTLSFFDLRKLKSPRESILEIVNNRCSKL